MGYLITAELRCLADADTEAEAVVALALMLAKCDQSTVAVCGLDVVACTKEEESCPPEPTNE